MTQSFAVRSRMEPPDELLRLASFQGGVVTRAQASTIGFSRHCQQRLVTQGRWRRLARGILLTHSQPPSWEALAWAGVLRGGEDARLGGFAAGYLHKLVDQPPAAILVLVPVGVELSTATSVAADSRWMYRRERPGVRSPRTIGSPARTLVEDTVLDLCDGRIGDGETKPPAHWVSAAVQRQLTTAHRLRRALDGRARISCRRELIDLLADVAEGAESPLELRFLDRVERPHDLPRGTRQAPARSLGRRARRDVRYERYRLLVELDGRIGHVGEDRFRDFRRDNEALVNGEATLRYGWTDVADEPCRIAWQVGWLLRRNGWTGAFTRCPVCPPDLCGL